LVDAVAKILKGYPPAPPVVDDGQIRRFGYFIAQPNATMDFVIHSLVASPEILSEFHDLVRVVFRLQPVVISLRIVENNVRDILDAINGCREALDALATPNVVPAESALNGLIAAAQRVSNFLAAATGFLSLAESQLREEYGKGSAEFDAWNKRRRELHRGSFAYRFLYELRNFSQHRALPISSFNISGERDAQTSTMRFKVGLEIIRDGLLVDGFSWSKQLKRDLEGQPEKFDLLPLIDEFLVIVQALCLDIFHIESARLAECLRYIDVVRKKIQAPPNAALAIFVGHSPAPGIPPARNEVIPEEQVKWLLKEFDDLLNLFADADEASSPTG
jgi:hypothetical protein